MIQRILFLKYNIYIHHNIWIKGFYHNVLNIYSKYYNHNKLNQLFSDIIYYKNYQNYQNLLSIILIKNITSNIINLFNKLYIVYINENLIIYLNMVKLNLTYFCNDDEWNQLM